MEIYLVGGAVRDHLLGLPIRERDWVVVGSSPEEMIKRSFLPVGKDFPVFLHPHTKEEYALARTERKTGRGYTEFTFNSSKEVTLEEDLQRRDLSINAMAMDSDGNIIDPYHGQRDLKNKLLKHVSPSFIEDPVRILRLARFYARYHILGFEIAQETLNLMQTMVANGEVDFLVAERVFQELYKALQEPEPAKFFEALRLCGALQKLFPEIDNLYGVPNPPLHHPEIDTGIHTMLVLQQATYLSEEPATRFAALLHDVGKALTPKALWPSHHGHEEAGIELVKTLCQRLKVPKDFRELAILTTQYHGHIHKALELRPKTVLEVLERVDAFRRPHRFEEFLLACEADSRGRPGYEMKAYPQRELFLQAYAAAKMVKPKEILKKDYNGKEIAHLIHQERLKNIKAVLK